MLASAALICGASLAVGGAIAAICGWGESRSAAERGRVSGGWSWLSGAIGLAALLAVAGVSARLPGHAATAAVALVLVTVASLVFLAWSGIGWRGPALGIPPAAIAAAAASLPFIVNERVGILGVGLVNDDMASHLLVTDWVQNRTEPVPNLVDGGYPLGPHSLVASLAEMLGADPVNVFAGLTLALAALGAITALALLRDLPAAPRIGGAVLASVPFLGAAYLVQGAFKEPLQALILIGFALGLRELIAGGMSTPTRLVIRALPLAVLAAGSVFNYSFPGLAWLGLTAVGVWLAAGAPVRALKPAWPVLAAVAAIAAVLTAPEWGRILEFSDFRAFERSGSQTLGNLKGSISPLEAFGVWPSGEFRVTPSTASLPAIAFYLGALLGAAALAAGLWRCWLERRAELPSALLAATLVYLAAVFFGTPYTAAKALAVAAPVVMLIALWGVLSADWLPEFDQLRPLRWIWKRLRRLRALTVSRKVALLGFAGFGVAFVLAAGVSSVLALRQGPVSPGLHAKELNEIRRIVEGGRVLFLGRDDFIAWELRGAKVDTPIKNFYNVGQPPTRFKATDGEEKFDFDVVNEGILDRYRYVLTTSSAYASEPPGNFKEVARTESFVLWKRRGPTARRETLHEVAAPGAVLSCDHEPRREDKDEGRGADEGKRKRDDGRSATDKEASESRPKVPKGTTVAAIWPTPPVAGSERKWAPSATVTVTEPASQGFDLEPGRWEVSLAYDSPRPLTIRLSGSALAKDPPSLLAPANLDFRGPSPPFRVGEIQVERDGRVEFRIELSEASIAGRLLGAEGEAHLRSIFATPLGELGEVRHVAPRKACGEYVDWLRVSEDPDDQPAKRSSKPRK